MSHELKPDTPAAMQKGYRQLEQYKQAAEAYYGYKFDVILDTYVSPNLNDYLMVKLRFLSYP